MPLFESSLSQSVVDQILSTTPTAATRSCALNNATDQEHISFLYSSSRLQTGQKQKTNDTDSSSQAQDVTSLCDVSSSALSSPYISPPISLIVGGPSSGSPRTPLTTFYVHAALLTSVSPFFRAAFANHSSQAGFLEARTLTMHLPEERPEDVTYLVEWLYSLRGRPTAQTLYHHLIDVPMQRMEEYKRDRAIIRAAERRGHVSQLVAERPRPPAFGPLIRLYIMADRLSIDGGLRAAICSRAKEVGVAAAAVPSKEDVWRLWDGIPKLASRVEELPRGGRCARSRPFGEGKRQEEDLRNVVLDMYANMRGWAVFEEVDGDDEGFSWHPLFMRALVVSLLRENKEARESTRSKELNCSCGNKKNGGKSKDAVGEIHVL